MSKFFTLILVCMTLVFSANAQKSKVVTAATLMGEGEIADAKKYIDEAFSSPEVEAFAKAWIVKGEVYNDVHKFQFGEALNVPNALIVADEAFRKGYELDMAAEKKPGRYKDRVQTGLFNTSIGHFEMGADKFNAGDFAASMQCFDMSFNAMSFLESKGLTEDNNDVAIIKKDASVNGALCALNLKDYERAASYYEKLIDMEAADEKVYANLAAIYIMTEQYDESMAVVKKGLALYPDNESLKESELNYYIATDQTDNAVGKLEDAIAANPNDPDLYFNVALAYDKLGKEEEMKAAYEKIIELAPDYHGAYLNMGAYYNEKANSVIKQMNEMDWKEAIALEPERNNYYNLALPYLEKAYDLAPEDEAVQRALERIYANLNMLEKIQEMKLK
ncbi:MAG: tetratricopeptide repeat protein [Bacteroidetes bacterium]|nr:tetratricopeptide repeat protein [Bacteroidota bacterium]